MASRRVYGRKPTPPRAPNGKHHPCMTEDMNYTDDELEWFKAVDRFKSEKRDQFPTLRDLLGILKRLGYTKGKTPGGM